MTRSLVDPMVIDSLAWRMRRVVIVPAAIDPEPFFDLKRNRSRYSIVL